MWNIWEVRSLANCDFFHSHSILTPLSYYLSLLPRQGERLWRRCRGRGQQERERESTAEQGSACDGHLRLQRSVHVSNVWFWLFFCCSCFVKTVCWLLCFSALFVGKYKRESTLFTCLSSTNIYIHTTTIGARCARSAFRCPCWRRATTPSALKRTDPSPSRWIICVLLCVLYVVFIVCCLLFVVCCLLFVVCKVCWTVPNSVRWSQRNC